LEETTTQQQTQTISPATKQLAEGEMGGSSGLVDWRGRPVNKKKHGGLRASIFIHGKLLY
jgi:hypothetical protein